MRLQASLEVGRDNVAAIHHRPLYGPHRPGKWVYDFRTYHGRITAIMHAGTGDRTLDGSSAWGVRCGNSRDNGVRTHGVVSRAHPPPGRTLGSR